MNKLLTIISFLLLITNTCNATILQDEFVANIKNNSSSINTYTNYNYESTKKIPIQLKILENINSESKLIEGQLLDFKVARDVIYNDKILVKRGTPVKTKVSIIITPGMNGIPASIIINNFEVQGLKSSKLTSSYEFIGQDRCLLVFPLKWALTILPPTGSLTNFIMGGHAKIKVKKPITIYYYPEWI